ncbi:hypothetical protein [Fluviicola taffensis]|uniref:Uncharacterized protein n=1 Tax=Fluviicola taffensis (strain DSM 16823 / NCIMB 13979 / RW262) TaxID=755732 RepID=F2IG30_FLUTR|nr:hypothetical protein [Fluviicola taffensis]AEA44665.1 hypothetical protein Fluta_2684 [Fluviicola taffensis DSM 16823]
MFKSYNELFGRKEDFIIKYCFYSKEEGGRQHLPYQHIRSDFWYNHPENKPNNVFMIYPEFLDNHGNPIEQGVILREGFAKMWILNPEMFDYHKSHISVGQKGFFHEGVIKTAKCEITEINGLLEL